MSSTVMYLMLRRRLCVSQWLLERRCHSRTLGRRRFCLQVTKKNGGLCACPSPSFLHDIVYVFRVRADGLVAAHTLRREAGSECSVVKRGYDFSSSQQAVCVACLVEPWATVCFVVMAESPASNTFTVVTFRLRLLTVRFSLL